MISCILFLFFYLSVIFVICFLCFVIRSCFNWEIYRNQLNYIFACYLRVNIITCRKQSIETNATAKIRWYELNNQNYQTLNNCFMFNLLRQRVGLSQWKSLYMCAWSTINSNQISFKLYHLLIKERKDTFNIGNLDK